MQQLLPDLPGFSIEQISIVDRMITVLAQSEMTSERCPDCAYLSSRVHSRYQRVLCDLPWNGRKVRLVLQVRRFFCLRPACPRKTFAQAIPAIAERYARRTIRLADVLLQIGLTVGAEPGARLTAPLGIPCSPDTLLRSMHRAPLSPPQPPRVVGIDDWSWRRGHTYGSIICDLERHCPIDLLADRSADSVEAWFKAHPSVEIISRDRGTTYVEGVGKGAPQAIQVADRWHLLGNLEEALEDQLALYLTTKRKSKTQEPTEPAGPVPLVPRVPRSSPKQERARQAHRQERLAQYEQLVTLAQRGLKQGEIARQVGVNLRTVQRWLAHGTFPERKPRQQASQLDAYQSFIQRRWSQGCHNVARIYQELCAQEGYRGSYAALYAYVSRKIGGYPVRKGTVRAPSMQASLSSRKAAWLFVRRPEDLTVEERETLMTVRQLHPQADLAYGFVQQFAQMVRHRTGAQLDGWLEAVATSGLAELQSFVTGVYQDKDAVLAGLTLPWSQGQTEGQVTRLKLIKRQMYGRAKLDLLRHRVLHVA